MSDSARWNEFNFRDDDIVISAPVKCGATWIQMICALLIFQRRTLPSKLDDISPWLEMLTRPLDEVLSDLETQNHRRFIKSHTPLDGLPFHERVTYVCVARDPRDVAISLDNHMANLNVTALLFALRTGAGLGDFSELIGQTSRARPSDMRKRFLQWVDEPQSPGLRATIHHVQTFWEARQRPNVILLHYADLKADLEAQMRGLAMRLDLSVRPDLWSELVKAATFIEMRKRADEIVPNATEALWHENARFFNKGSNGQWKRYLKEADLLHYRARITELADPDLLAWLHPAPV